MSNKPPSSGRMGRKLPGESDPTSIVSIVANLVKPLIGKNIPSWGRSIATLLGGAAVTYGVLTADSQADGLQVGEVVSVGLGFLAIWGSRFTNWLRAKRLGGRSMDKFGQALGVLIGRSIHSLARAIMTAIAGGLATYGLIADSGNLEQAANVHVGEVIAAILLWALNRAYSYYQEGKEKGGLRAVPIDPSELRP